MFMGPWSWDVSGEPPDGKIRPVEGSERDAYLDRVVIEGRERREIVIADYDPAWPVRFGRERERIRNALGDTALVVEHIGSTAVPGLAAKAVIDILVTVEDPDDDSQLVPSLALAGYELRVREPGHRMFGPQPGTSTYTSGARPTLRSGATCASETGCGRRLKTGRRTSS